MNVRRKIMLGAASVVLTVMTLAAGWIPQGIERAGAAPAYPVMNAEGGLYWRSAPDWNTPIARSGFGVYPGTVITIQCFQAGSSVPGSANTMWVQASWASGPGTGSGWINEHFVNDGAAMHQAAPGVPACGSAAPAPAPSSSTSAVLAATTHVTPWSGVSGVTVLCGPQALDYSCTRAGYAGQNAGWPGAKYGAGYAATNQYGLHNCTLYAAYRLLANGLADPGWSANANDWDTAAAARGTRVDQSAAVGSIAQWNAGAGHVAYVEAVDSTGITITADSYINANTGWTNSFKIAPGSPAWPDNFIHLKDVAAAPAPAPAPTPAPAPSADSRYAGYIVQWNGDTKAQKTAWLVMPDLTRRWIPDAATYFALKALGAPGPVALSSSQLDALRDQTGIRATADHLGVNWQVGRNTTIWSSANGYALIFQGDGNLVVYAPGGRAIWATNRFSATKLVMQSDGNLVLYDAASRAVWSSGTAGQGRSQLIMQADGNLVVRRADGKPTWASGTDGGRNRLGNPAGFRL